MTVMEQANQKGITGFLHPLELEKLAETAVGRDVLEIGSFKGLSAYGMALGAKTLTCVDTFKAWTDGQQQAEELTTLGDFERAMRGFDNVQTVIATSEEAARRLTGDYDMVFLDAMHTYEDVKADLGRWWPRVRPGGVLAIHDYRHDHHPGVTQAVDEMFGAAPPDGWLVTLRMIEKP